MHAQNGAAGAGVPDRVEVRITKEAGGSASPVLKAMAIFAEEDRFEATVCRHA